MTKISLNPERQEIEITRNIGKSGDGRVTINTEGGGAVKINLGVGSLGVTTDYGGAISLGIGGQEVTWGREGGTIHLGIGGFEVDVEARDCIVTEIKSIAGIVVAQRSYPDPGCKPQEPIKRPTSNLPPGKDPDAVGVPDSDASGWVFVHVKYESIRPELSDPDYQLDYFIREITSPIEARRQGAVGVCPVDITSTHSRTKTSTAYNKNLKLWVHEIPVYDTVGWMKGEVALHTALASSSASSVYLTGDEQPLFFWGAFRDIKKFLEIRNKQNAEIVAFSPTSYENTTYIPYACIPFYGEVELPQGQPFLPTGNKPPMKDCCEDILDELADIKEGLDIDRILKDKFPVSNTFMAPQCDPTSTTEAKSYYEIMQCLFRMLAHGMIFEPKVMIKDADAAKAGDQEFKAGYLNATGWASAVSEALMEVKDDGNVGTNMDIRSGFAATQTMVGMADANYKIDVILDCLGVTLIPKAETVETPYNLMIQIGKGFGKDNERQIDLNQDEATEALLPQLLQTKKNTIKTVAIHPRSRTVKEILENIEAELSRGISG